MRVKSCRFRQQYPEMLLHDDCLLTKDGFPKARFHALVIPCAAELLDLGCLAAAHLPLLDRMEVCH